MTGVAFAVMCLALIFKSHGFERRQEFAVKRSGRQSFDLEPEDLEVNPGQIGVLDCKVFDKNRESLCRWQKDGISIRVPQAGKYEWQGSPDNGDCSLRIIDSDINFDDGTSNFSIRSSSSRI